MERQFHELTTMEGTWWWLREHLEYKRLDRVEDLPPFDKNGLDLAGRVFSSSVEWRYEKEGSVYRCLLASLQPTTTLSTPSRGEVETMNVSSLYEEPKEIFVRSLTALMGNREEDVADGKVRVLVREYAFTDGIGGTGYMLCGVTGR
ncbi:hypothetical protein [Geobacillus sp. C56-T2]|uniref:hypothetical protein n=1 Tax=Geobacillus sp. C56-T2 TaxID=600773 RepID=UPI0011A3222E|nr:hypothetical protein [Geobacillus sp. C56-T2]